MPDQDRLKPFRELLRNPTREEYQQVLHRLLDELSAERGCMWLERQNAFVYEGDEELRKRFPFSRQAVDQVLEKGRSFISFEDVKDVRFPPSGSMLKHNVRSCICAACENDNGDVLVLAYFDNGMAANPFSVDDLEFLNEVLSLVPGAIAVRF